MTGGVLAVLLWVSPAWADPAPCASAQVRTEANDGHCCWWGQSWNGERCAGTPTCPLGLTIEGDACVGGVVVPIDQIPRR